MRKSFWHRILKKINPHLAWIARQWYTQRWFVLIMLFFTLGSSAVSVAYPMIAGRLIGVLRRLLNSPLS